MIQDRDRFPNTVFFLKEVRKSDIRKEIINWNSLKVSQNSDIATKIVKQNIHISYYTLYSILAWKISSSYPFEKQLLCLQYLKRTVGSIRTIR